MPYEFYKFLHFVGLFTLITMIGAVIYQTWSHGDATIKARRWLMIFHGIAVTIILVSGFGLMAKLGMMSGWPPWIWVKLATWTFVIVVPSLVMRIPATRKFMWWLFPIILFATAFSVTYKVGV